MNHNDSTRELIGVRGNHSVQPSRDQDNSLALKRRFFREAIDELGWKHDAICVLLKVKPAYFSKMLAGGKPITQKHIDALPDDAEARFYEKCATLHGLIVVEPLHGAAAMKAAVAGLIGLMSAPQLPARADAMVKLTSTGSRKAVNE